MASGYPLEMLPLEVWEMIILEVEESADIRSLLKTSKQFSNCFMKIRHLWLLDKVLPFLIPTSSYSKRYLGIKDLKNLRLVDKRWSRAVNAFLENQPSLRPYNKSDDNVSSEEHIRFNQRCVGKDRESLEIGNVIFFHFFKTIKFRSTFYNSERNPFLSRSVVGKAKLGNERVTFWDEMDKLVFQKHGKHIWFLRMMVDCNGYNFRDKWISKTMWKGIVNSLCSLPNLKSLHVNLAYLEKYDMDYEEIEEFMKLEENQLPPLASLESLEIYPTTVLVSLELLSKYHVQLRRLKISIMLLESRKKWTLPNLTELSIDGIFESQSVTRMLTSLEAPLLTKLELKSFYDRVNDPIKIDIFLWIALFPSLLHLNLSCTGFVIGERGTGIQDLNVPLKFLKIGKLLQGINYNFLRYLPNLEHLQICFQPSDWMTTKSFYNLCVWEVCPKLKTILMTNHLSEYKFHRFHRETYEKSKRK